MARRPKPNHLHIVEGTGRADRHALAEAPQPVVTDTPAPPGHLTPDAMVVWPQIAAVVASMRLLTTADLLALESMCECYAEMLRLRLRLQELGDPTYETQSAAGGRMVRAYPEAAMLADADRRFKSYLVEFGMTPAARTKVKVPNGAKKDPASRFFDAG